MRLFKSQNGVSLIAAIFIIVVLAFMGLMFLSLINTSSLTSVNDMQSAQALYIAEGGVEFAQLALAQNLDWYRSASDPMSPPTATPLGAGSFTVTTTLPATVLSRRLPAGGGTATVYTTNRFPTACPSMPLGVCYLQIEDDAGSGSGEFVSYTNTTATTFTGLVRNRTIGTVPSFGGDSTHLRGSRVYPVSVLAAGTALVANCNTIPNPFQIIANSKFLSAGTINVYDSTTPANDEEILYSGATTTGNITTLTGVQRCQNQLGVPVPIAAVTGSPVTPINFDGTSPDYEAEVASTGASGAAMRVVKKTVQR
jgi:MSHA biogenesis protein MshP